MFLNAGRMERSLYYPQSHEGSDDHNSCGDEEGKHERVVGVLVSVRNTRPWIHHYGILYLEVYYVF